MDRYNFEIPEELVEEFVHGNAVLFVGAGLSIGAGLPSWDELILPLADKLKLPDNDPIRYDLPRLAQYYENEKGRNALNSHLINNLKTNAIEPSNNHRKIVSIKTNTIITTNFDDLIEKTLRKVNKDFVKVTQDNQIPYTSQDKILLLKLHGDLENPATITITENDYLAYFDNYEGIKIEIESLIQKKTFLFVGYRIQDIDYNQIRMKIANKLKKHQKKSYAIFINAQNSDVSILENNNINVINIKTTIDETQIKEINERELVSHVLGKCLDELTQRIVNLYERKKIHKGTNIDESYYRKWIRDETNSIDVKGIYIEGLTIFPSLPMRDIYIRLHVRPGITAFGIEFIKKRIPLDEIVEDNRCLVVIGNPGSGKTTFLRYLSRNYVDDLSRPLPLYLQLNNLYEYIKNNKSANIRNESHKVLTDFICERNIVFDWKINSLWLSEKLEQGTIIVLLDGFDELPSDSARHKIIKIIERASKIWTKTRFVLTSRPGVFRGKTIPDGFKIFQIDSLNKNEISSFVDKWVHFLFLYLVQLTKDKFSYFYEKQYVKDLQNAISSRRDVFLLARNPVILTIMAVVHWNSKKLPEGRAQLYRILIEYLIDNRRVTSDRSNRVSFFERYQTLAFAMFQDIEGRKEQVKISWAAQKIYCLFSGKTKKDQLDAAKKFLELDEINTGILIHRGENDISFWHLSLQEFFAARQIVSNDEDKTWTLIEENLYKIEWNEVLRFIPTMLYEIFGSSRTEKFIERVLATRGDDSLLENARIVGLLGNVIHDLAVYNYPVSDMEVYTKIRNEVLKIFSEEGLEIDLSTRYNAAVALGKYEDPRFFNLEKNWISIPMGNVLIGAQSKNSSGNNFDKMATDDEQAVHNVYSASFKIGKYPVTVIEFDRFVKDGGYKDKSLWTEKGWEWKDRLISQGISLPENWEEQLEFPNCPAVFISWHEANAYCEWLTKRDDDMIYRLPTESEWEFVARRGKKEYSQYCADVKDKLQKEINWEYCGLEKLAPVGLFPLDKSFDNVMDLNGNIREWVLDSFPTYYSKKAVQANLLKDHESDHRYLRGGSWHHTARSCRTAHRDCRLLSTRADDVSFRVLCERKPIKLKGRLPNVSYSAKLSDIFAKNMNARFSTKKIQELFLKLRPDCVVDIEEDIFKKLFPYNSSFKKRNFLRLPCVMGDDADKLDYNLLYQDTQIKLAVEEKIEKKSEPSLYEKEAYILMEIITDLLRTKTEKKQELWKSLTDNDLDALIYLILNIYDPDRNNRLKRIGHETNKYALNGINLYKYNNLEHMIKYQTFAGTIWWLEINKETENNGRNLLDKQFEKIEDLTINAFNIFKESVLYKNCHLVFFFGDNGELVWDLAIIDTLLKSNPKISITGVINTEVIANNANIATIKKCFQDERFQNLNKCDRFKLFEEKYFRSAIDPNFCSNNLLELLDKADFAFIKGSSAFEIMQKLPLDSFYSFMVNSVDSQIWSGLKKGSGVFAFIPAGQIGYNYKISTLLKYSTDLKII